MNAEIVGKGGQEQGRRSVATLVSAFEQDPVARWIFPASPQYREHFPRVVRAFAEPALAAGTVWGVDGFAGAAVWLAPHQESDEHTLSEAVVQGVEPGRQTAVLELFARMSEVHPQQPHWYLPMVGVVPSHQGRGYGSALLAAACRVCDREGLPAYLEATTPGSAALYRRHGFRPVGEIRVRGGPSLLPMERRPRRAVTGRLAA